MHLSFEYFPPKTTQGLDKLITTTNELKQFNPEFFSVTYGAGGSEQNKTLETVSQLQTNCHVEVAAHITCIGSTKEKLRMLLQQYQRSNIRRLVALRGDLPSGMVSLSNDFQNAYQLIKFIREETGDYFFIEAAAYPEMHPETPNPQQSIDHLKMKCDAGANRFITQYFYNADGYYHLREAAAKTNINLPIIPGIMPITNYTQLARFSKMCGAEIPRWMHMHLQPIEDDAEAIKAFGIDFLTQFCSDLIHNDVPGLHFYTLNKAEASINIIKRLQLTQAHHA